MIFKEGINTEFNMNDYTGCEHKPEVNVTDSSFMMIIPNIRYNQANTNKSDKLSEQEMQALRLIENDGFATSETLTAALNLGVTRSYTILKKMADVKLRAVKNGRCIEYKLL